MRPVAVMSAALACTLLASQAVAGITTWSNPRDPGPRATDTRLTVFATYAFPQGEFGSTSSSGAAHARAGMGLGLDFSSRYSHDLEAGVVLLGDLNPTDSDALGRNFAATLRRYGLPSEPFVVDAKPWQTAWLLAKVGYAPKLAERLRVSVDVYGGWLYGDIPELELIAGPPNVSLRQAKSSWFGLAAGLGAGLSWRDRVTVGIRYLSGASPVASGATYDSPFRRPLTTLHATLGYTFGH